MVFRYNFSIITGDPDTGKSTILKEVSMMDMRLTHQLFQQLRPGAKVLFVGDADQLESVGPGSVLRELINSGMIPVTVLDQIFRQTEGSLIAHNAKRINEGYGDLHYGRDFVFVEADTQEEVAELVRCFYMEEAAETGIDRIQILSPFRSRGAASANELNVVIREEINPPAESKPEIASGGRLFRLGDLELACAMTIYKSQGSEYETVIIPMLAAHKILCPAICSTPPQPAQNGV